MKKRIILSILCLFAFTLSACNGDSTGTTENNGRPEDAKIQLLQFPHLDGYGNEVMRDMPILFEYEMRDFVKYQVAYVSCTCRAPRVNYWSIAFFTVSKVTGEVLSLTFSDDDTEGYLAGVWGDSDPIPGTGKTYQDFKSDFIPWLVGQNLRDLDGINIFYDDTPPQYSNQANTKTIGEPDMIDAYAGSSVTTNNLIRVTKTLLQHHEERYMND